MVKNKFLDYMNVEEIKEMEEEYNYPFSNYRIREPVEIESQSV